MYNKQTSLNSILRGSICLTLYSPYSPGQEINFSRFSTAKYMFVFIHLCKKQVFQDSLTPSLQTSYAASLHPTNIFSRGGRNCVKALLNNALANFFTSIVFFMEGTSRISCIIKGTWPVPAINAVICIFSLAIGWEYVAFLYYYRDLPCI